MKNSQNISRKLGNKKRVEMMFVLGVIVGVIITVTIGIVVLAWVCDRAYELGRKDEKERKKP